MNIKKILKSHITVAAIIVIPTIYVGAYLFGIFDSYKPMSPDSELLHLLGAFLILPIITLREAGVLPSNIIVIFTSIIIVELIWIFLIIKISHVIYILIKNIKAKINELQNHENT